MRKCRRIIRVDIMNKEVKGWTSSLKQQEAPPKPTNTKEEILLEHIKIKVKRAALQWYDFVLQEQLKSFMYIDRLSRGYQNKEILIDELSFKNCMRLKRKTTRKLFVGITYQKRKFIIHPEYFDPNNIFSHPFIQNLKNKPIIVHDLSRQMNIAL